MGNTLFDLRQRRSILTTLRGLTRLKIEKYQYRGYNQAKIGEGAALSGDSRSASDSCFHSAPISQRKMMSEVEDLHQETLNVRAPWEEGPDLRLATGVE